MADMQDDRIPVRFASPAQVGAGDVLLVEDGAVQPLLRADCTIIRFRTGGAAHLPGCACCAGRGAAATALGELFQVRADLELVDNARGTHGHPAQSSHSVWKLPAWSTRS